MSILAKKEKLRKKGKKFYAIIDRVNPQPFNCEWCGDETSKLQRHHPDYLKLDEIIWVCQSCHTIIHCRDLAFNQR